VSVYKRKSVWWYKFRFANRVIRESTKSESKTLAKKAEGQRRRQLEEGFNDLGDKREERIQTISTTASKYLEEYTLKHRSPSFATYAVGHLTRLLGARMLIDISDDTVRQYQTWRLREGAAPKSINEEVGFLLRILEDRGDAIRIKLRRAKALKLKTGPGVGRAFSGEEKLKLIGAATPGKAPKDKQSQVGPRSPYILPALTIALNTGMRDAEIRNLTWGQIDFEKRFLTVGKSKTQAGEGRTIPLNTPLLTALLDHARWFTSKFGTASAEWYVFPGRLGRPAAGKKRPLDPCKPITSMKTAWRNVRTRAGVEGRLHDARHTLITELAERGEGDQTIMDIAGHVSRQMLSRYSHIRMEVKRRALDSLGTNPAFQGSAIVERMPVETTTQADSTTWGTKMGTPSS
jgi:integrase